MTEILTLQASIVPSALLMLKFFSLKGSVGRLGFFESWLLRLLIHFVILLTFCWFSKLVNGETFVSVWSLSSCPLVAPIYFRRANELGMNYALIVLCLSVDLVSSAGLIPLTAGLLFAATKIYPWIMFLGLLFKPGQMQKDSSDPKSRVLDFWYKFLRPCVDRAGTQGAPAYPRPLFSSYLQ